MGGGELISFVTGDYYNQTLLWNSRFSPSLELPEELSS